MTTKINHETLAISRLATQFSESVNLKAYITSMLSEANNLEQALQDTVVMRWLVNATGKQLDAIGVLVGQPRIIISASLIKYFGFGNDNLGFSSGASFKSLDSIDTGNRLLDDNEYRFFIGTRVIKNNLLITIPNLISFFMRTFAVEHVNITDGYLVYSVQLGRMLTENEKSLLLHTDLVPKVAGFRVSYSNYDNDDFFGFAAMPNSKGFAGKFASLID